MGAEGDSGRAGFLVVLVSFPQCLVCVGAETSLRLAPLLLPAATQRQQVGLGYVVWHWESRGLNSADPG